jgi:hypothetical protein
MMRYEYTINYPVILARIILAYLRVGGQSSTEMQCDQQAKTLESVLY